MSSLPIQRWASIAMFVALVGCQTGSESTKPPTDNATSGARPTLRTERKSESLMLDESTVVRYTVQVPKGYLPDEPRPLVVALHFGGRVTPYFGASVIDVLVGPALDDLNAVIVAPDSTGGRWSDEKNTRAILAVIERVKQDYAIDERRTLLTGFSMGGHGTFNFGGQHQQQFTAALPIAGNPSLPDDVEWKIPLYVIHSRADEVVPIGPTREFIQQQKSRGADVTFVEVEDLTHYQTVEFIRYLKEAIPWIRRAWGDAGGQN